MLLPKWAHIDSFFRGFHDWLPATTQDSLAPRLIAGGGRILGSPAYMSPEQALGQEVDARGVAASRGAEPRPEGTKHLQKYVESIYNRKRPHL